MVFQELCGQSHITSVDMHGSMKRLFLPCCLPSGGEAPGADFSGQQSRHTTGQRQITGHDLAWKLQQIRFLMSQSTSSSPAGTCLGSQLLITAGAKMPAADPGAAWDQLGRQLPSLCSAEGGWQGPEDRGEAILVKEQQHSLYSTGSATCRGASGGGLPGRGGHSCVVLWAQTKPGQNCLQPISHGARLAGEGVSRITGPPCPLRGGRGQEGSIPRHLSSTNYLPA